MQITAKSEFLQTKTQVPQSIIEALNLKDGEEIIWQVMPDGFITVRTKNRQTTDLKGILPKPTEPVALDEMRV